MDIFTEISIIIAITFVISGILHYLKQPLVIGYIVSGIIVGPSLLNLVSSPETMGIFAHIGIALLLFTVGLSLNPKMIKDVGKVSLITGLGQVIFTSGVGFLIAMALGFSVVVSIYIAVALTFSSTIIIMKLLGDKGDTDTLYGKIAIGFLLIQDLVVVLVLIVVASLSGGFSIEALAMGLLVKGVGLLGAIILASYYLLPKVTKVIAKSQEFLLLFSIGWCMALASLTYQLGFSIEIGALLAGVTLAMSPYRYEISSKMRPLRDFFIVLFFILLGSQMEFLDIASQIIPILVFSIFILVGNPIIVMTLMGLMGYTKRNSFFAGLTVAQISEFSLIFIALGITVGHLNNEILSLVTVVGLITIAGSTYLILYADKIYTYLEEYLSVFERRGKKVDDYKYKEKEAHVMILFGYNRIGFDILKAFKQFKKKFLIIDYNPNVISSLTEREVNCHYADVNDAELFEELNLSKVRMIISTIPKVSSNILLINKIREVKARAIIIVVATRVDDALRLYDAGATYVLLPHMVGATHISSMIKKCNFSISDFNNIREKHLKNLNKRLSNN